MEYLLIAFIVAFILICIYRTYYSKKEGLINTNEIIIAVDKIQKNGGTFDDFKLAIGQPKFSPLKYAQLIYLYKANKLSIDNAKLVL